MNQELSQIQKFQIGYQLKIQPLTENNSSETNLNCQKMDSTTEIYFDEIVENFIKLVQAVHEVGDKVQKERLSEKRAELYQVMSLIEPEKNELDSSEEENDDESDEEYEPRFQRYVHYAPETFKMWS